MKLNWKYLKTKAGKITYCACQGDKLIHEFTDMNLAYHFEKDSLEREFKNSIDDFLSDQKRMVEAKMRGGNPVSEIELTDSSSFRAEQRKILKAEERKILKAEEDKKK